jgi:tRNA modification GTPase
MSVYFPNETIAAIATPLGEGGVAMIRISGKEAVSIAAKVFSGPIHSYKSHTAHYGYIFDAQRKKVDDVLLLPMLGKRSYTGEPTVEIFCHGGTLITRRVLETVLQAGARAAQPGEFTLRAFLNGKLDLAQAEAVQTLISAKNEHALAAADNQLQGALSQKIEHFQYLLTDIAAILEAWIDFPEEGLEFASIEEIENHLTQVMREMQHLLNTFHEGKMIREGISLCLIGCPNAGKSSLMNALLDKERAIVSSIPGTTRDLLEESVLINGLHMRLIDTAGIRDSEELIEQEGVRRSKKALEQADLILLVLDITREVGEEELSLIQQVLEKKTVVIWNKIDLPHSPPKALNFSHVASVSAKEKIGLENLHQKIDDILWKQGPPAHDEVLITHVRHKEALNRAIDACKAVISGLKADVSPEFLTQDMRLCLQELGKIIGTDVTEDILSAIFSKFCIGK